MLFFFNNLNYIELTLNNKLIFIFGNLFAAK